MIIIPRWQTILIGLILLLGVLFAAPNLLDRGAERNGLTRFLPERQLSLGLDLQGGVRIVIEVDTSEVGKDYLNSLDSSVRAPLRRERIAIDAPEVKNDVLIVRTKEPSNLDAAFELLKDIDSDVSVTRTGDAIEIRMTESALTSRIESVILQSVEVVRRRVDPSGLLEPSIRRSQDARIQVEIPGIGATELAAIKGRLERAAKLEFRLLTAAPPALTAPLGSELVPDERQPDLMYAVENRAFLTGDQIVDAQPTFDRNQQPATSIRVDGRGANIIAKVSGEAMQRPEGWQRRFAIILDGKVISAPEYIQQITGTQSQITGMGTTENANDLAILLRAGALPAPLVIIEERLVGPGLGADSIAAGGYALLMGLVFVMGFMWLMYGRFGIFANIALAFNLVLIVALLSAFGAVLTLPGIAGIVLTIGMAVDANVLVFERTREDYANSGRVIRSLESGYNNALSTIVDANLTTVIAAAVLAIFSDGGPVRGFAITLSIGIVTSVFTALMVTRVMVAWWAARNVDGDLPMGRRNPGVARVSAEQEGREGAAA